MTSTSLTALFHRLPAVSSINPPFPSHLHKNQSHMSPAAEMALHPAWSLPVCLMLRCCHPILNPAFGRRLSFHFFQGSSERLKAIDLRIYSDINHLETRALEINLQELVNRPYYVTMPPER